MKGSRKFTADRTTPRAIEEVNVVRVLAAPSRRIPPGSISLDWLVHKHEEDEKQEASGLFCGRSLMKYANINNFKRLFCVEFTFFKFVIVDDVANVLFCLILLLK